MAEVKITITAEGNASGVLEGITSTVEKLNASISGVQKGVENV